MKKTPVETNNLQLIDYKHPICFLGSCFSVSLSEKMKYCNFEVDSNPFGVIFNPLSLGHFLLNFKDDSWDYNVVQREDLYFSWEANSSIFGYSQTEIYAKMKNACNWFESSLQKSKVLFITFGTAWVYELRENNNVVANCHKFNKSIFDKRLLSIEEILIHWQNVVDYLKIQYPELNIVFTLSPVRHIKDGLTENARSKAILLESIHRLVEAHGSCHYFPSYEIILDELRDYAFFKVDGIHSNDIAIDEVWKKFVPAMFSKQTQDISDEWIELRKILEHKIQFEESEEAQKFIEYRSQRLITFKQKYPEIILNI